MHWPLECIGPRLPRIETIHLRQRSRLDSRLSCLPNRSVSEAIEQREIPGLEELEGRPSLQQSLAMSREIPGWLRFDDWQASKLTTVRQSLKALSSSTFHSQQSKSKLTRFI